MAVTPFKFLDSYTRDDQEIFFGREKEIEELYFKIFESSLLIVYGSSGTGKTSLIQCGLASKFQDADWMPVIVRRANNINESLKKTLQNIALVPLKKKNTLPQDIQSIYLDYFKPMFVLFDQFEELFIFGGDEEIEEFTDGIKTCLEANLSCRFIFVIRGEYLENLARFEDKIPDFFNNRIRIERMTRKNAMQVIIQPARLFNIQVSDSFPEKVLEKLSAGKGSVELTYLQVYLDKLYKSAVALNPGHPEFNDALLNKSGKIDDVLAQFLDEQIAKTSNPEEALAVLKAFISNEGTKKQMSEDGVIDFMLALGKQINGVVLEKYIRQFVDLRILKDKDENGKYELRHDALAAKIFEQISHTEKEMLEVRQFIMNRYDDFKKRGTYLEFSDIQYIKPYENKMLLSGEQKEFVAKSIKISKQKKQRTRNIVIAATSVLILVLASFTVFAVMQRNEAVMQSQIAGQKTTEALNQKELAEKAQQLSMEASKKALNAKDFAELQKNIADSQSRIANAQTQIANDQTLKAKEQSNMARQQKELAEKEAKNAMEQSELARQQKLVAEQEKEKAVTAQSEADRLRLVSLSQTVAFKSIQVKNDPQLAALLGNEAYNLARDHNGTLQDPQIYNALFQSLKNLATTSFPPVTNIEPELKAMSASPDGQMQVIFANGKLARYSGTDDKPASSIALGAEAVNTSYLSNDCKYSVTTYDDNSIRIWNNATGSGSAALQGHSGLVRAVAFGNDGGMVLTGGRDSSVIVWNNGKLQKQIKFPSRIRALALTDNNGSMLAGCEDGIVYTCDLSGGNMAQLVNNSPGRIQCIANSNHNKFIIVSSSNGRVNVLNSAGKLIKNLSEGYSVDFVSADDGSELFAEALGNRLVRIYNLNDLSQKPLEISDIKTAIKGLALSGQGVLSVACGNNTIRSYPVRSATIQGLLAGKITRAMTQDEWNTYIGKDVPFKGK
jgi:WD40 repeat protein